MSSEKKSRGGRPPRVEGEKLQRINLSLRPSLMFGLELLARAQGRSLSQAVEWALQMGLNNFPVGRDGDTIASVIDDAWQQHHPFDRLRTLYNADPGLLTFEDRGAIELFEQSVEWRDAIEWHERSNPDHFKHVDQSEWRKLQASRREIVLEYIRALWGEIGPIGAKRFAEGSRVDGISILSEGIHALGLTEFTDDFYKLDAFAVMQALTESKGEGPSKILARARDLDSAFIWSVRYKAKPKA